MNLMYLWKLNVCSHKLDDRTESELISLDGGLRMDGILALDIWDVVIEVLPSSKNRKSSTQGAARQCLQNSNTKFKKKSNRNVDNLSDLNYMVTNASPSQCEAQL